MTAGTGPARIPPTRTGTTLTGGTAMTRSPDPLSDQFERF